MAHFNIIPKNGKYSKFWNLLESFWRIKVVLNACEKEQFHTFYSKHAFIV
jgi:hypothetical protein